MLSRLDERHLPFYLDIEEEENVPLYQCYGFRVVKELTILGTYIRLWVMLRNGAKLEVVGRILGHASIGITADVYRHVNRGEMREEAERFAPLDGKKALKE